MVSIATVHFSHHNTIVDADNTLLNGMPLRSNKIFFTKRDRIGQSAIVYQLLTSRPKMGRFLPSMSQNNKGSGISGKWEKYRIETFLKVT